MSDAQVKFYTEDQIEAAPGQEALFSFTCPKGKVCWGLIIAGRTDIKRDPMSRNGGIAQWDWDGNRDAPTFTPSINCAGCWHGYIRAGRCVTTSGADEQGAN